MKFVGILISFFMVVSCSNTPPPNLPYSSGFERVQNQHMMPTGTMPEGIPHATTIMPANPQYTMPYRPKNNPNAMDTPNFSMPMHSHSNTMPHSAMPMVMDDVTKGQTDLSMPMAPIEPLESANTPMPQAMPWQQPPVDARTPELPWQQQGAGGYEPFNAPSASEIDPMFKGGSALGSPQDAALAEQAFQEGQIPEGAGDMNRMFGASSDPLKNDMPPMPAYSSELQQEILQQNASPYPLMPQPQGQGRDFGSEGWQ